MACWSWPPQLDFGLEMRRKAMGGEQAMAFVLVPVPEPAQVAWHVQVSESAMLAEHAEARVCFCLPAQYRRHRRHLRRRHRLIAESPPAQRRRLS